MTWHAFTARKEVLAAKELRELGYDAFAFMMLDRRRKHRHRGKAAANFKPEPIVALRGYVFVRDPDLWTIARNTEHVRQPVRFCGRMAGIPLREMQALLNPRSPFFHDTDVPRFNQPSAAPVVKAGDVVRFTLAAETLDCPVMSVDGETLLVQVRHMLLGRDTMRIRAGSVELVA